MTASDWLLAVAETAKRLNEESRRESTRGMEVLAQQGTGEGQQPSSGE